MFVLLDGETECVLLEDNSSIPEGEQVPCTDTIFRGKQTQNKFYIYLIWKDLKNV